MNQTTVSPETTPRIESSRRPKTGPKLPQWRVLLHNDDVHEMGYVTQILCHITSLPLAHAFLAMLTAHREGSAVVLETHREHAELVVERLRGAGLASSLEHAE